MLATLLHSIRGNMTEVKRETFVAISARNKHALLIRNHYGTFPLLSLPIHIRRAILRQLGA